jgi:hypothetical protein
MSAEQDGHDDEISEETRQMVAAIRQRAAQSPGSAEIADLLTSAGAKGSQMSAEDIRALGRATLAQAQQVSYLLGKLAVLIEGGDP